MYVMPCNMLGYRCDFHANGADINSRGTTDQIG